MTIRVRALTRIAARTFGAARAVVRLRDPWRDWPGPASRAGPAEDPWVTAWCEMVLHHVGPLVVEDANREDGAIAIGVDPAARFLAGAPLRARDGHPLGALLVVGDAPCRPGAAQLATLVDLAAGIEAILDLASAVAVLQRTVDRDYLTGLLSRQRFDGLLEDAVRTATGRADAEAGCMLLCLDIDGFKAINDAHGHEAGDAVLVETARRLGRSVRQGDHVARLSGDELAILMAAPASPRQAHRLAGRILDAFAVPFAWGGIPIPIRISLGAAAAPADAGDARRLMRCADQSLYRAKRMGGHRCCHAGSAPTRTPSSPLLRMMRSGIAGAQGPDDGPDGLRDDAEAGRTPQQADGSRHRVSSAGAPSRWR